MPFNVSLRKLSPRDCDALSYMDTRLPPGDRWPPKKFLALCRQPDRICLVFYRGTNPDHLLGYMVFAARDHDLALTKQNLPRNYLFNNLHRTFLTWAQDHARTLGKLYLSAWTRDTDLHSQIQLRELGFLCHRVIQGFYQDPPASCYLFRKESASADE